jgi:hypothetical protein|tara:strand:+ start:2487 stop:2636 length:150 start_codon:yes stop_codon:yes gene_type:complete
MAQFSEAFFNAHFPKNLYHECGCFFYPDRPPVIYQLEIGKVVEKGDLFQ